MARLVLVAILFATVFSFASAEWWAVALEYTANTNCAADKILSASIVKNDTCVHYNYHRFVCSAETQIFYDFPNCDSTSVVGEHPLDSCVEPPVPQKRLINSATMYKCVEAASQAEAISFLRGTSDMTLMTVVTTNSISDCASTPDEVKVTASTCEMAIRKRDAAGAYFTSSCNSTHTLYYDCIDDACLSCTLIDAVAFTCNVGEFSSQSGCLVVPAFPAPADAPVEAPVAAPMAAASPVAAPVADAASPVAAPQASTTVPVAETLAPNSATQVVLSLAVVVASVLAVLF